MSHSMRAIVFRCMDGRLHLTATAKLLSELGYPEGTYDLASFAGSAKDMLSTLAGEAEHVCKQIDLSVKLHGITDVVILYHDNCGAYGIANPAAEEETEREDLNRIKAILAVKFPELQAVKTYIIKGTPSGDLSLAAA